MDNSENAGSRFQSGLRPLTRYTPATTIDAPGLQEITESQNNVRASATSMGPPQGVKRPHGATFSQPEAKRKTLIERGGECYGSKPGAPAITPGPRSNVKGAPLTALTSGIKPPQTSVPVSRHTSSASVSSLSSRHTSSSSYATSVGPSSRPPSALGRPMSIVSFSQSVSGRTRPHARPRPATAMGNHAMEEDELAGGKNQNGMTTPLPTRRSVKASQALLRNRKLRTAASEQSLSSQHGRADTREVSITTRLSNLRLDDDGPDNKAPYGSRVIPEHGIRSPPPPYQSAARMEDVTVRSARRDEEARQLILRPTEPLSDAIKLPQTPSRGGQEIDQFMENLGTAIASAKMTSRSPTKAVSPVKLPFLTKESNLTTFTGWDMDERLGGIESHFKELKDAVSLSLTDRKTLEDAVDIAKNRVTQLERERDRIDDRNLHLQSELDNLREQNQSLTLTLERERRTHSYDLEDKARELRDRVDELRKQVEDETERLKRDHREALEALQRHHRVELEDERSQKVAEIQEVKTKLGSEQHDMKTVLLDKDREVDAMRFQIESLKGDLDRELTLRSNIQKQVSEMSMTNMTLEDRMRALRAQIEFLESDSKQQSDSFASMEARMQEALRAAEEARQKLIKEETERRILFNKYQELKGNIRVMCRVRPPADQGTEGDEAGIAFPDTKTSAQIEVMGPEEKSSLGVVSRKANPFEFDRVFGPSVQNEEVFDEISQLVQSALDGYNVCIFCYGQTGSGKTYTMSSADGMIPRATHMIYDTITRLKDKSWSYSMEGSFVEVYNEELHDLLMPSGKDADPKKKLEIRHDEAHKQTAVLNCRTVSLDSAEKVEAMLRTAQGNRSVAATRSNERSSRSHSVFMLRLAGVNAATGERCDGTLNLVDLAGSERVKASGAEGDRMREAQSINRSLACLGDVIEALGRGAAHVPYRNSKLTHLLQYSLGGNSKTLMFVMVSPLEAHLKETLTSLRFATKVHNTHIGTAKSTKKTRERSSES